MVKKLKADLEEKKQGISTLQASDRRVKSTESKPDYHGWIARG